jgi:hypothetical protein
MTADEFNSLNIGDAFDKLKFFKTGDVFKTTYKVTDKNERSIRYTPLHSVHLLGSSVESKNLFLLDKLLSIDVGKSSSSSSKEVIVFAGKLMF